MKFNRNSRTQRKSTKDCRGVQTLSCWFKAWSSTFKMTQIWAHKSLPLPLTQKVTIVQVKYLHLVVQLQKNQKTNPNLSKVHKKIPPNPIQMRVVKRVQTLRIVRLLKMTPTFWYHLTLELHQFWACLNYLHEATPASNQMIRRQVRQIELPNLIQF